MRLVQSRVVAEKDVDLNPYTVTGVVASDALVACDHRAKPVTEIQNLLLNIFIGSLTRQSGDVFETCSCPVVDDE